MTTQSDDHELVDSPFGVGDWLVEPRLNRLTRGEESIQIELKMMDVLVCLAGRAGELVTRREIIDTVWATEFITEKTLTRAVAELRRTLGDDARQPRYIETIHRKGYRLIAPTEVVQQPAPTVTPFPSRSLRREDERSPYPGLAAFTEDDAEFFFGREAEVAQLWRKITSRRLLAVIGPSGVGKSSLLRAGLIPASPEGWGTLIIHPGESAFRALGRALVPVFKEDTRATAELLDIDAPDQAVAVVSRWRALHRRALLIVDQFEELLTLNPAETQARFGGFLGRLARDADVHVLLSMRDDFLYRCHAHPPLRPILEDLTALERPHRASLRRALEQPAARLGYAFESDDLVAEMLDEVTEERSALPFLAFAAARLWDMRDRDRQLLTRQAFEDIGGVGGALVRHAEAVLQAIGSDRTPMVRELFRNLVTAEGTRAVRSDDDLLSVFPDQHRDEAANVLGRLVDARLLTSFQQEALEGDGGRKVEVAHESLLTNWPRLVRWQTQDSEGAQFRDELRQAARTWQEHDRLDDLLWTGSAYREFVVWRERYPGGLTDTEGAFGEAMTRHTKRRTRRRRTSVAAAFITLLGVLAIIGGFWRSSVTEARRAEAANLFSLAQLRLEEHPTSALAYATASLELADNPRVRRLALEALWQGPTEIRLPARSPYSVDFSADGRWLLTAHPESGLELWPSDGGPPLALDFRETTGEGRISPSGNFVASTFKNMKETGLWSFPAGRFLRSLPLGGTYNQLFWFSRDGERLITSTENLQGESLEVMIRSWPLAGGEPDLLARLDVPKESGGTFFGVDPTESLLAWIDSTRFNITPLKGTSPGSAPPVSLEHDRPLVVAVFDEEGQRLATADNTGTIRVWSLDRDPPAPTRTVTGAGWPSPWGLRFDPSGTMLASSSGYLANLTGPPNAEPVRLRRPGARYGVAFHPQSRWLATGHSGSVSLWPLARRYPWVLRGHEAGVNSVQFTADGTSIASASKDGTVRLWPLGNSSGRRSKTLYRGEGGNDIPRELAIAPDGSFLVFGTLNGQVFALSLTGGPLRELRGFADLIVRVAVDSRSRLVAAGAGRFDATQALVRVWDLESDEAHILDAGDGREIEHLEFTEEGDLWVKSGPMLRRWKVQAGNPHAVEEIDLSSPGFVGQRLHGFDPDSRQALLCDDDRVWLQNIDTHESRELSSHRSHDDCSWHADHEIVVSVDYSGGIRVGRMTDGEPHLLPGPDEGSVAISPDGRWIASSSEDSTIRLWPMPDLSRPPLHTLPRDELLARLRSFTNLRVVEDPGSPSGWKVEVGPFPGWDTMPQW